jgi:hypothetical protein
VNPRDNFVAMGRKLPALLNCGKRSVLRTRTLPGDPLYYRKSPVWADGAE